MWKREKGGSRKCVCKSLYCCTVTPSFPSFPFLPTSSSSSLPLPPQQAACFHLGLCGAGVWSLAEVRPGDHGRAVFPFGLWHRHAQGQPLETECVPGHSQVCPSRSCITRMTFFFFFFLSIWFHGHILTIYSHPIHCLMSHLCISPFLPCLSGCLLSSVSLFVSTRVCTAFCASSVLLAGSKRLKHSVICGIH